MTDKIVVMTACGSEDEAARIASVLVEKKLAACVNILPGVTSVYRWKGGVEKEPEVLLLIKTRRGLMGEVRREIEVHHSYELPEAIALSVVDGSEPYLLWFQE